MMVMMMKFILVQVWRRPALWSLARVSQPGSWWVTWNWIEHQKLCQEIKYDYISDILSFKNVIHKENDSSKGPSPTTALKLCVWIAPQVNSWPLTGEGTSGNAALTKRPTVRMACDWSACCQSPRYRRVLKAFLLTGRIIGGTPAGRWQVSSCQQNWTLSCDRPRSGSSCLTSNQLAVIWRISGWSAVNGIRAARRFGMTSRSSLTFTPFLLQRSAEPAAPVLWEYLVDLMADPSAPPVVWTVLNCSSALWVWNWEFWWSRIQLLLSGSDYFFETRQILKLRPPDSWREVTFDLSVLSH